MLTCCQSSNLISAFSFRLSSCAGLCTSFTSSSWYSLGPMSNLLRNVFYAAKQAETVSYAVVFNVLLIQLAYSQHESCATMQGYWYKHNTVHLWVFSLHSNHKGHAVSACLWFRKEAILISCTYCNAHCSQFYLSFSHECLLHTM